MKGRSLLILIISFTYYIYGVPVAGGEEALQPLQRVLSRDAETASPATPAGAAAATVQQPPLRIRVTSPRLVILSSQISGKVTSMPVRDGDVIQPGQTLMALDDSLYHIQRDRTTAALNRQDLVYSMIQELVDRGTKGETEARVAQADREQAAAELRHVEAMIAKHRMEAPFSGRVTEVFVREQQYVGEGQPVLQVVDEADLALEFIMNSSWMRHYPVGHVFRIKIFETGETHDARIERYGGRVDPVSQSVKVYARLTDAGNLMEGMSGEAILPPPPPDEAAS